MALADARTCHGSRSGSSSRCTRSSRSAFGFAGLGVLGDRPLSSPGKEHVRPERQHQHADGDRVGGRSDVFVLLAEPHHGGSGRATVSLAHAKGGTACAPPFREMWAHGNDPSRARAREQSMKGDVAKEDRCRERSSPSVGTATERSDVRLAARDKAAGSRRLKRRRRDARPKGLDQLTCLPSTSRGSARMRGREPSSLGSGSAVYCAR